MWEALLGLFGGGNKGTPSPEGGTTGGTTGQLFGTFTGASDRMQAKYEQGSVQRDALIRQALLSAPTQNLGFEKLAPTAGASGTPTNAGVNLGQKENKGSMLNFIKGLFTTDESDTAIPEEDEARLERETQAQARSTARATSRAEMESDPKTSANFYAELQSLFNSPE